MRRHIAAAGLVAVIAAGCGSAGSDTTSGDQAVNGRLSLDTSANGKTVHVHLGDTVTVTLDSTYWSFLPTGGLALQPFAPVATAAGSACPKHPGSGCGTVTATYNVRRVGTSVVHAHRDTCGEALRCVGTQGDWSVTVVAT